MKYEVGQVIFLLNSAELKIIPVQIEEEIIRRKAGSESTQYKVCLPTKTRDQVNLDDLDVDAFDTCSDLRTHMVENAIKTIDALIDRAQKISRVFERQVSDENVRDEHDVVE